MRAITRSPRRLAEHAWALGKAALSRYSSPFSCHEFTEVQLFAILVLKHVFKTDYHGITAVLIGWTKAFQSEVHEVPLVLVNEKTSLILKIGLDSIHGHLATPSRPRYYP